jgi:hypothetical protein
MTTETQVDYSVMSKNSLEKKYLVGNKEKITGGK